MLVIKSALVKEKEVVRLKPITNTIELKRTIADKVVNVNPNGRLIYVSSTQNHPVHYGYNPTRLNPLKQDDFRIYNTS